MLNVSSMMETYKRFGKMEKKKKYFQQSLANAIKWHFHLQIWAERAGWIHLEQQAAERSLWSGLEHSEFQQ